MCNYGNTLTWLRDKLIFMWPISSNLLLHIKLRSFYDDIYLLHNSSAIILLHNVMCLILNYEYV